MAMDSMKFGPEWLRNMKSGDSSGGIGNNAPAPLSAPIKMAEFRYGREEMLALFDRGILPPDPLRQMQGLFVKERQEPLALLQMTEEETRMWNRGINSDAALRLSKPGAVGVGPGGPRGAMGGRGGSVDRGRGRARGSYHYSRGLSYEDQDNTNGYVPRGRNNYDRSQSGGGWGERNGGDTGDSPRKEFGSRSLSDTNWRRHRVSGGEEDDGWRATTRPSDKWGRGNSNSWREGEGWDRSSRTWEETNNSHPAPRKPWDNEEGNLPEWAMENPSESGGSFDASGAFHGGTVYSDDEDVNNSNTNHQRGTTRPEQSKTSTSQPRPAPQSKKEPPNITNGTPALQETGGGDRDTSNTVPLRQSHSATSLATAADRRPPLHPHPITTSASFSGVNSHPSLSAVESKPQREQPPRKPTPLNQHAAYTNYIQPKPVEEPKPPQKPSHEDEMEQRLLNDADVFVSRLMDEEDSEPIPSPSNNSPSHRHPTTQSPIPNPNSDIRWVYQDPQGEIQGNFTAIEMTEWHNMGYFKPSLLVRRTRDEVFLPISEMKKYWTEEKPFEVDYHTLPPIKKSPPTLLPQSLPPAAPPAPALDETLLLQYQMHQQLQLHHKQQAIFARLSQSEHFNSLSPLEQRQLVAQQISMEPLQGGLMLPHLQQHAATPATNTNVIAVLQMLAAQQQQHQQLQQQRLGVGAGSVPVQVGLPPATEAPLDPLQQIMSQIGLQTPAGRPQAPATPQNTPDDQRSFDQFLNSFRQRQATAVPQPQPQPQPQPPRQPQSVVMESVWGGPAAAPSFPGWSVPPGHPPATVQPQSLWADPIAKGIKTEADILEEQLREEKLKKEELRQQEELLRLKQEEEERERIRQKEEEEELERKRLEEEEREREERRRREAEEKKKKEAAAKKAEQDRLKKEEEKKRKEEEKRRKEEEKRKQEEERKRAEEEKKRLEEEKKKQEEMAKRQNEALKRIQEQQQAQAQARAVKVAPTPAPWTPPEPTGPSLADIQKTERKQQQQLREQQEMLRAYQEKHQKEQQQQQLKNSKSASGLNLKWAETPNPVPTRVKSLAEIQAEEQERMAKQAEKEKAERMAANKDVPAQATGSIWQSATQSLTWNSPGAAASSVWGPIPVNPGGGGGARFFDEDRNKPTAKPQAQAQAKAQAQAQAQAQAKAPAKTKAKKEEATVMKLFEKQVPKTAKAEEFNKWCSKALHDANGLDIPTFIDFLVSVETQVEIQEYSQPYLGDAQKAAVFAAEFMLRRKRLLCNNPQPDTRHELPAPPAQPSNNFQEVKGKNKKMKKKNMTKVDSRILGFNVTAAPDRINVGDRDYGENI